MNPSDPLASRLVTLLGRLAPQEGYNLSPLEDVRFLRSDRPLTGVPVLYDPGVVIVCQGGKRGYFGDRVYQYDAQHYLVVSVPVPFTMETDASPEAPLLAIYLRLDFRLLGDLVLQLDSELGPALEAPRGLYASPIDEPLRVSTLRFLEVLSVPTDARLLGPALLRELYYRILTGAQGGSLRAALDRQGRFGRIARSLRTLHARYAERLDVAALAQEARMSQSSFHRHFRDITGTTPMQYLKSTRLHQARLLMLRDALPAANAAFAVGYESASQFSREFKRLFGRTPLAEIDWMKATYALPAPPATAVYVASH